MIVALHDVYGIDGEKAWYRKLGYGFDFVSDIKFASQMTEDECRNIVEHDQWYCKMYGARRMSIEEDK